MGTGEIIRTIVQEFPYALYGSVLVGSLCAFLGVYVVARRVVFLGAVLTQVSVLGLAITFLPFFAVPHTVGSLVITLGAIVGLSHLLRGKNVSRDAILGLVFVFSIAARILVIQNAPKVEVAEVENLLRGDILFVTPELFVLTAVVSFAAIIVHILLFKEFNYISFDAETAGTHGYNTTWWEIVFYFIAAVVISVSTHMVGDVFVFGFLVVPPMTAMLLARTVKGIFVVSTLIGVMTPPLGLFLAFVLDVPSSPTIVSVAVALLLAAWFLRLRERV